MKTMKKEILALMVICLVLTFSAASARAEAVSTSQARIDWTSLTISGDITWSNKGSESHAYSEDDTGSDEDVQTESGWVNTSAFASVYHASGNADTNDKYLYEEVYAIANDAITTWASCYEVYAWRWGSFTANSNGWVKFSADYKLSQDLETGYGYGNEWAYGYAEAGLYLENDADWDQDMPVLENEVWDGDSVTDLHKGILTVSLWFDAGNEGYFEAWVYNDADVEVPEPTIICLLGLGVLGLLRRKR
jgi:hypothetical protein